MNLHHGDCLDVLRTMPDNSVDSIVTDPPAGIAFMGKDWDKDKGGRVGWIAWMSDVAAECLRVIKPGGHVLVWAIPRTSHWTGTAWEMAGWQPRDKIYHVFGSGIPKSHDISKAIDKAAGAVREVTGFYDTRGLQESNKAGRSSTGITGNQNVHFHNGCDSKIASITTPATPAAQQWQGWGTALKPALEPITLARKPFTCTVAENVLQHGTGALNIDVSRVAVDGEENPSMARRAAAGISCKCGMDMDSANRIKRGLPAFNKDISQFVNGNPGEALGRWPANLIHDGSADVVAGFPDSVSTGGLTQGVGCNDGRVYVMQGKAPFLGAHAGGLGDAGSAARFFYCSKASKADRDEGLDAMQETFKKSWNTREDVDGIKKGWGADSETTYRNTHPTVKPTDLMRYLCRLITPPGGIVLDPYMGSGSTGKAAMLEGFGFIGIEREADYLAIARARIEAAQAATEFMKNPPLATVTIAQEATQNIAQLELA